MIGENIETVDYLFDYLASEKRLYQFEVWLNGKYVEGTVDKIYTNLSTVMNYLWELRDELQIEMTDKFKSKRFRRGKKSKNDPDPLTEDQLTILYKHRFATLHLETVRKMILLQCFTGIR